MAKLTLPQCRAIACYALSRVLYEYHSSLVTASSVSTPTDFSWNKAVDFFAARLFYLVRAGSDVAAQKAIFEALVSHGSNYVWVLDIFTRSIFHMGHGWSSLPYNPYAVYTFVTEAIDDIALLDPAPASGGSGGSVDPEILGESIAAALSEVLEPIVLRINNFDLDF